MLIIVHLYLNNNDNYDDNNSHDNKGGFRPWGTGTACRSAGSTPGSTGAAPREGRP